MSKPRHGLRRRKAHPSELTSSRSVLVAGRAKHDETPSGVTGVLTRPGAWTGVLALPRPQRTGEKPVLTTSHTYRGVLT